MWTFPVLVGAMVRAQVQRSPAEQKSPRQKGSWAVLVFVEQATSKCWVIGSVLLVAKACLPKGLHATHSRVPSSLCRAPLPGKILAEAPGAEVCVVAGVYSCRLPF